MEDAGPCVSMEWALLSVATEKHYTPPSQPRSSCCLCFVLEIVAKQVEVEPARFQQFQSTQDLVHLWGGELIEKVFKVIDLCHHYC